MNRTRAFGGTFHACLDKCLDACLPTRCLLCTDAGGAVPNLCDECSRALPRLEPRAGGTCRQCAADITGGTLCARCLSAPPPFERVQAPFLYRAPVDALVRAVKFHGRRSAANTVAHLLAESLVRDPLASDAVVVPVPLHPRRLAERGFDQNLRVLGVVAHRSKVSIAPDALSRIQQAGAQSAARSVSVRTINVAAAFVVNDVASVHGRHVVLFDDVVTSGATARAAAAALRAAGARTVEILAFARTPAARSGRQ